MSFLLGAQIPPSITHEHIAFRETRLLYSPDHLVVSGTDRHRSRTIPYNALYRSIMRDLSSTILVQKGWSCLGFGKVKQADLLLMASRQKM